MPTFTIADNDLEALVRRDIWRNLRHHGALPAGAVVAAPALALIHPALGTLALGMAIAWTYSLVGMLRGIRPGYYFRHGSGAGPLTVEFEDEGIRTSMPMGTGIIFWSQLSRIKNYEGYFILEGDGEELLILPKRYFTAEELALLQSKVAEVDRSHVS